MLIPTRSYGVDDFVTIFSNIDLGRANVVENLEDTTINKLYFLGAVQEFKATEPFQLSYNLIILNGASLERPLAWLTRLTNRWILSGDTYSTDISPSTVRRAFRVDISGYEQRVFHL